MRNLGKLGDTLGPETCPFLLHAWAISLISRTREGAGALIAGCRATSVGERGALLECLKVMDSLCLAGW